MPSAVTNLEQIMSQEWPKAHIQEAKDSLAFQYVLICHEVHCRARATHTSGWGCASHETLAWATAWISQVLHFRPNPVNSIPTHPRHLAEFPHNEKPPLYHQWLHLPLLTPKPIYYYIHTLMASSHRLKVVLIKLQFLKWVTRSHKSKEMLGLLYTE